MMLNPEFSLLLAAGDGVAAVVVAVITIIGWIIKLANSQKTKAPPVSSRPRPAARPRDTRVAEEINIFVEDNTRGSQRPNRQATPPARPQPVSNKASRRQQQQQGGGKRKARPGEELSRRHAPVAENLGGGVSQHLRQHMPERVEKQAEQRVAPHVDEKVAADLGAAVATSTTSLLGGPNPAAMVKSPAARMAELLRTPAGMQQAVVMNLILSPPPGRARTQRS
ncbi:MAG: hypothetical protein JSS02_17140 [Planctomycetes bacterium]|nr:hypothetical protein [Planctomycetota bacterium]